MIILDKLLHEVDVWLGLRGLPLITYLFLGFVLNLALSTGGSPPQLSRGLLVLATLALFTSATEHVVDGIEEREVTSDVINMYLNRYFRWSTHGSHYDLAPLDAVPKVMLSYIVNEVADEVIKTMGLNNVRKIYKLVLHGVGWLGDVKRIALKIDKIKKLGFKPAISSREAVRRRTTRRLLEKVLKA